MTQEGNQWNLYNKNIADIFKLVGNCWAWFVCLGKQKQKNPLKKLNLIPTIDNWEIQKWKKEYELNYKCLRTYRIEGRLLTQQKVLKNKTVK